MVKLCIQIEYHQVLLLGNKRGGYVSLEKGAIKKYSELAQQLANSISSDIGEPVKYFKFDVSNSYQVSKFNESIHTIIIDNMDKLLTFSSK